MHTEDGTGAVAVSLARHAAIISGVCGEGHVVVIGIIPVGGIADVTS